MKISIPATRENFSIPGIGNISSSKMLKLSFKIVGKMNINNPEMMLNANRLICPSSEIVFLFVLCLRTSSVNISLILKLSWMYKWANKVM